MARTDQGKALTVAGLAFSGAVLGTSFGQGGMRFGVGIAAAAGFAIALIGFVYSRRSEEADAAKKKMVDEERESQERARLAKEHEEFLDGAVYCEDTACCYDSKLFKRRQLWRLPPLQGGKAVCANCFSHRVHHQPEAGKDKPAFE